MSRKPAYETIGRGYSSARRPDPRIERQIHRALGDAPRVVNIGAGAGSYEPSGRTVAALEPSAVMLGQRADAAAPAVRGVAEAMPFPDDAFDVAMAILTVHHWSDRPAGLAEMCRVAPRRVALVFDQDVSASFWLYRDYTVASNAIEADRAPRVEMIADALGADRVEVVPVPHDCTDGFGGAYWRRPEAYLDPAVRAGISSLAVLDPRDLEPSLARLRTDLESGVWHERYADLLVREEIDLGYRLVVTT